MVVRWPECTIGTSKRHDGYMELAHFSFYKKLVLWESLEYLESMQLMLTLWRGYTADHWEGRHPGVGQWRSHRDGEAQ